MAPAAASFAGRARDGAPLPVRGGRPAARALAILCLLSAASCTSRTDPGAPRDPEGTIAALFRDGPGEGWEVFPWKQRVETVPGGALGSRASLALNADRAARPWAVVYLRRRRRAAALDPGRPTLARGDLERGVVEFHVNGGPDAQGVHRPPAGGLQVALWQAPRVRAGREVRIAAAHIEGGAWDGDPATWQRVRIPLDRFTRDPTSIFAVSFQLVGACAVAPRIDEVRLRRLREPPPAPPPAAAVAFPEVASIDPSLTVPRDAAIEVRDGAIRIAGRPTFLVGTIGLYDPRGDLWGYPPVPPPQSGRTWSGYPRDLAWLYEAPLDRATATRLGLNAFAIHVPPEPFWEAIIPGARPRHWWRDPEETARTVSRVGLPLLADFSGFTWGAGKVEELGAALPPRAAARGRVHMLPFSLLEEGRALYERFFRSVAGYLHREGVRVEVYEIFNEPAYDGDPALHGEDFARWLRARYGDLDGLRRRTGIEIEDFGDAAGRAARKGDAALYMAWRDYLAERFLEVVRAAQRAIRDAAPASVHRFAVQLQSGDAVEGAPGIDPVALAEALDWIASPTDGGIWTFGSTADRRPAHAIDSPLAPAPITPDLLVSLAAGRKPIVDHEAYAPGRTGGALRRKLWRRVLTGFDGVILYAWSKRADEWGDARSGRRAAELRHWCLLNPYAHPSEELTGILRFRRELAPLAPDILPEPSGEAPAIAYLHSHTTERVHEIRHTPRAWGRKAYAALRYLGYPLRVLVEAQVREGLARGIPALVVGGASHLAPGVLEALAAYARAGGIVVAVDAPLDRDRWDRPVAVGPLLGIRWGAEEERAERGTLALALPDPRDLPGRITGRCWREIEPVDARIVGRDAAGRACITARDLGRGRVYTVSFEAPDYRLAKLLLAILRAEGIRRPWTLAFRDTGELAPNVLLSARDRGRRKLFLAANEDGYAKDLVLRVDPGPGRWTARDGLDPGRVLARGEGRDLASEGIPLRLPPREIGVIVIERDAAGGR